MRKQGTLHFIMMALVLVFFTALPLFAGGKQEKEEPAQEESTEQQQPAEEESAQEQEGTPIPSGSVSTEGEVAAVVGGTEIPMKLLQQQVQMYQQQMAQRGQQPQGIQLSDMKSQALESLINAEVLYQAATEQGYKADQEKIDSRIDSYKQQSGGDAQFQSRLKQQDMSEDLLRERIAQGFVIQQFIQEQFAPQVTISDEAAREYYDENPQTFQQDEQVRASHILIEVKEDASEEKKEEARTTLNEVQSKLDEGAEFSELAREYSEGPSAKNGGDLGYFGRNQMVKPFSDQAFSMDKGEVSGIVETRFGYHLIKVTDKKEAGSIPYEEVKDRILNYLKEKRMNDLISEFLEEKKQEMEIERTALQGGGE